jgi:hypothetical protein
LSKVGNKIDKEIEDFEIDRIVNLIDHNSLERKIYYENSNINFDKGSLKFEENNKNIYFDYD